MKLKSQLLAVACSLMILNPLDAARALQNPRTLHDTAGVLQDMHGQMKLMQEQLSSLKASQALLSAESAIKNLTPKVRRLEVHLERLEKQLSHGASSNELGALKNEVSDLKQRLQAYVSAPDVSVESTLSALNPTLERMQKQVYYLHESLKKHQEINSSELNKEVQTILNRFGQFEVAVNNKLVDLDSASASLNIIRQTLQASHQLSTSLKVDIETIKAKTLPEIQSELESLKTQATHELWVQDLNEVKHQVQKLASVFHKGIKGMQEAETQAAKAIEMSQTVGVKVEELTASCDKYLTGLKTLYKKEAALQDELNLVKNLVEQKLLAHDENIHIANLQNLSEHKEKLLQVENALTSHKDQISDLYQKSHLAASKDDLVQIHEKVSELSASVQQVKDEDKLAAIGDIKDQLNVFESKFEEVRALDTALQKQSQQIGYLYEKSKVAAEAQDVASLKEGLMTHINQLEALTLEVKNGLTHQDREALEASVLEVASGLKALQSSFDPAEYHSVLSTLKDQSLMSQDRLEKQTKQIGFLYDKLKITAKLDDVEELRKDMAALDSFHLKAAFRDCESKIDELNSLYLRLSDDKKKEMQHEMDKLASDTFIQISELKKSLDNVTFENGGLFAGINARLDAMNHHASELERLHKQSCYLYEKTKNLVSKADMDMLGNALKEEHEWFLQVQSRVQEFGQQFNEVKEKTAKLEEKVSNFEHTQGTLMNHLSSLTAHLEDNKENVNLKQDLDNLKVKLEEKDSQIDKLSKRVAYLVNTLKTQQESKSHDESLNLAKFKDAIEERVNQEMKAIHHDRVMFDTLIQRIAALEASLSGEDTAEQ